MSKKNRFFSLLFLIIGLFLFFPFSVKAANLFWTQNTASDFAQGTPDGNTDLNVSPGNILIAETLSTATDTAKNDFDYGRSDNTDLTVVNSASGEVALSKTHSYNLRTSPALNSDSVYHSWLDTSSNLLYVSTYGGGLSVIDTKGTTTTADDTLAITYGVSSNPAIASNDVMSSWLDTSSNLLYVNAYEGGLSVIDTKGTITTTDDTLWKNYKTNTTPAIRSNNVWHSWFATSSNLLYVGTYGGGLSVIDTKGTVTTTDDTLTFTYSTTSNPAIVNDKVDHSWLDTSSNLLYVSTYGGGLSVIDTKGTATTTDDTLWKNYKTNTTPAIANNLVSMSWLDTTFNLLYVSTNGGLSVIDTKGTVTTTDDTLAITYNFSSSPAIADNSVAHSWLDTTSNLLYVSAYVGLSVIDTKGTATTTDDTVAATYSDNSSQGMVGNTVESSWMNTTTNYLYVSTFKNGLSVIKPDYNTSGTYLSRVINTASTSARVISWQAATSTDTAVAIQTRSGVSSSYWIDDFNDDDNSNVSDLQAWGTPFNTLSAEGGILTMSDPEDASGAYMWVDTGQTFPAGSIIRGKFRANTSASELFTYIFTDDWSDVYLSYDYSSNNSWVYFSMVTTMPVSSIAFGPSWYSGTAWQSEDAFQIDWISVESPDGWSGWSSSYTNSYGSEITSDLDQPNLQYRAVLSTGNVAQTPTLNSVTVAAGYQATSTYTSAIFDTGIIVNGVNFNTLSWASTEPSGTAITFKARSGKQPDLSDAASFASLDQTIVSGVTNLDELAGVANGDRYFQFQAVLSTNSSSTSPTLSSTSLSYQPIVIASGQGGSSGYASPTVVSVTTSTPPTSTIPTPPVISPSTPDASCPAIISGDMVKVAGKPAIYAINKYLQTLYFPSGDEFKSWRPTYGGYKSITQACFDSLNVPNSYPAAVNYRPGSYLIKRASSDQLYVVEPNNTLSKISSTTAKSLYSTSAYTGGTGYKIMTIADPFWPHYINRASDVTSIKVHPGMLIKTNNIIYYIDDGNQLREVTDAGFIANQFQQRFVRVVPTSAIQDLTFGEKITSEIKTLTDKTQSGE
jgi:hypothetical protein